MAKGAKLLRGNPTDGGIVGTAPDFEEFKQSSLLAIAKFASLSMNFSLFFKGWLACLFKGRPGWWPVCSFQWMTGVCVWAHGFVSRIFRELWRMAHWSNVNKAPRTNTTFFWKNWKNWKNPCTSWGGTNPSDLNCNGFVPTFPRGSTARWFQNLDSGTDEAAPRKMAGARRLARQHVLTWVWIKGRNQSYQKLFAPEADKVGMILFVKDSHSLHTDVLQLISVRFALRPYPAETVSIHYSG